MFGFHVFLNFEYLTLCGVPIEDSNYFFVSTLAMLVIMSVNSY